MTVLRARLALVASRSNVRGLTRPSAGDSPGVALGFRRRGRSARRPKKVLGSCGGIGLVL
jgi:hypothetical protein